MTDSKPTDTSVLEKHIVGFVEPHIYAFSVNGYPCYTDSWKIGDTYRPVDTRIGEWGKVFDEGIEKKYEKSAKINDDVYYRDYSIHQYLEEKGKENIKREDVDINIPFSQEFFRDVTAKDIDEAIYDIKLHFQNNSFKYNYYNASTTLPETREYASTGMWEPRKPMQEDTIKNFLKAYKSGHRNLLMYAVMRFGKSFTSMCCAKEIGAKFVLVVSAKADVKDEWQKTVQSADNFNGNGPDRIKYVFLDKKSLQDLNIIKKTFSEGKRILLFLTLQDLQGDEIKEKHKSIFTNDIDMLLVDETHYGARAEKYGKILLNSRDKKIEIKARKRFEDNAETEEKNTKDDYVATQEADKIIKTLDPKVTIHLSGTPYRILMGSEFDEKDIIAFYQFSDIDDAQKVWNSEHLTKESDENGNEIKEWDNPYYGFPQMLRFAFNLNKSAREKLECLANEGISYSLSELLKPVSIGKDSDGNLHKKFIHEKEVLDLFSIIDGSQKDDDILSFLDYDKIIKGKMCRHIVVVLPYCASCDALENLIKNNSDKFKHLNEYEIINISGHEIKEKYNTVEKIKQEIEGFENKQQKTITLTVNRMLTGSTVEEWDTMIYLKDTSSPQEYDQAIFRIQNPHIRTYTSTDKNKADIVKENRKPQTLLVDFAPLRMFVLQAKKSQIYNLNIAEGGNSELEKRLVKELKISPIISMNANKISEITPNDIISAITDYSKNRGVAEEVAELPVDLSLMDIDEIKRIIMQENEFGTNQGIAIPVTENEGSDIDTENIEGITDENEEPENLPEYDNIQTPNTTEKKQDTDSLKIIENKFRSYYARILFFTFLTKDKVISLKRIIDVIDNGENRRISQNLRINKRILSIIYEKINKITLNELDKSIYEINLLSAETEYKDITERVDVAIRKFGKLGVSEFVTPLKECEFMVNSIPEQAFKNTIKQNTRFLDIASKQGEFANAICKKYDSMGIPKDLYKDKICSIPTSSIAYEFTRKVYELLGLNIDNIAQNYTSYDLLNIKTNSGKLDYKKMAEYIMQNKKFSDISLTETDLTNYEENRMKFEAVVGNPPYQKTIKNTSDEQIYYHFMDLSYILSNKAVLITPAKFLHNAGKTPKKWNQKMLSDEHLKIIRHEANSGNVFPGTNINGGLVITYHDSNQTFEPVTFFGIDKKIIAIKDKVIKHKSFSTIKDMVYLQNKFDLEAIKTDYPDISSKIGSNGREKRILSSAFSKLSELFIDEPKKGYYKILGNDSDKNRTFKYINKKYIDSYGNIDKYKIIMSATDGASGVIGQPIPARIVGKQCAANPNEGYNQTFISIGNFDTEIERDNLSKYLSGKFSRFMIGTLKATNGLKYEVWANVPTQNFSNDSDIDWSESISNIDKQFYKKYNLSKDEIDYIESMIK